MDNYRRSERIQKQIDTAELDLAKKKEVIARLKRQKKSALNSERSAKKAEQQRKQNQVQTTLRFTDLTEEFRRLLGK